jgi:hypothetical protein
MPRVYFFVEGWSWEEIRADLEDEEKETEGRQDEQIKFLAELIKTLRIAGHPVTDPRLRPWKPTRYSGVIKTKGKGFHLYEYRLKGIARVIAAHYDDDSEDRHDSLLLLFADFGHDHKKLKRLLKQHRAEISGWEPPEADE